MKRRYYVSTFEAHDIQKQITECKHDRAKKLLESRLNTTYMESFVDLENRKATIWILKDEISETCAEKLDEKWSNRF